jgi:hypothetical protein
MADLLKKTTFTGSIIRDGHAIDVTFHAHAAEDFRLHVELEPVPASKALF